MRKVRIFLKSAFFTDDRLVLLGLVTSDHDKKKRKLSEKWSAWFDYCHSRLPHGCNTQCKLYREHELQREQCSEVRLWVGGIE
jgi:hypothetical protein